MVTQRTIRRNLQLKLRLAASSLSTVASLVGHGTYGVVEPFFVLTLQACAS